VPQPRGLLLLLLLLLLLSCQLQAVPPGLKHSYVISTQLALLLLLLLLLLVYSS